MAALDERGELTVLFGGLEPDDTPLPICRSDFQPAKA
jgi:hypothetical protein